ncbi:ParA family protein [Geobacter hydrogenophilus]|uniref:ATPase n=1 Tax=Geobacter hydrogenophilus TaxID=40983 RepID=A0A9W6LCS6_9BACT|nr:ParA family protein [Geobacter hydrogenophilus]MBT0893809.1 ParA family protein [Geobacter hydrogenophilus]GLI38250.1 ATPase [Geobacter hydrogenophilus]
MASYSFWNNKGGVGKSYLCFVAASEYAHKHPDTDVYVVDLCPQANCSETLLGGYLTSPNALNTMIQKKPRATIAGYLEARLSSPFKMIDDVTPFVTTPNDFNQNIPSNLKLICGDNLLEILAEAIRQTSQLAVPLDAWKQVISWVKDLTVSLKTVSGERDTLFILDCNPSFAVYTQLAIAASDYLVVPFTADDSSRRAIENVVALLYGVGDPHTATYARINFSKRAKEDGVDIPKFHTFVNNRVTFYEGSASKAFKAVSKAIKQTMEDIYEKHRSFFSSPKEAPSKKFIEVPDYHSACIVSALTGTSLHKLKAGPHKLIGERIQINQEPLDKYRTSLGKLVDSL